MRFPKRLRVIDCFTVSFVVGWLDENMFRATDAGPWTVYEIIVCNFILVLGELYQLIETETNFVQTIFYTSIFLNKNCSTLIQISL